MEREKERGEGEWHAAVSELWDAAGIDFRRIMAHVENIFHWKYLQDALVLYRNHREITDIL